MTNRPAATAASARAHATARTRTLASVLALCGVASLAHAQVPAYSGLELQASSLNLLFNLPGGSSISNSSPSINNTRTVAFKYDAPFVSGIWYGANAVGGSVYTVSTDPNFVLVSDAVLGASGDAIFTQDSPIRAIYRYSQTSGTTGIYTNQPIGQQSIALGNINAAGKVGYRVGFGFGVGNAWTVFNPATSSTSIYAGESGVVIGSPISFLYTPSFNDLDQVAGRVDLGSTSLSTIRRYSAPETFVTIAQSVGLDPTSPFQSFDNSVGLSNLGDVAFVATRTAAAGGGRGVFLYKQSTGQIVTIALAGQGGVGTTSGGIEFFAPRVNRQGVVVFRAFNSAGQRAIFVGDGSASPTSLATRDTVVPTPPALSGVITIRRDDGSPHFGGSPSINDFGDVAFNAQLNGGISAGIIVAKAVRPAPCYANCDSSTIAPVLNAGDFTCFLTRFRAAQSLPVAQQTTDYTNCDGSTIAPVLNAGDFTCFLTQFRAGCPN